MDRKKDAISAAFTIVTLLTLTLHKQSPSYVLRSPSIHRYYKKKRVEKEINRFGMTRDLSIVYSQKEEDITEQMKFILFASEARTIEYMY